MTVPPPEVIGPHRDAAAGHGAAIRGAGRAHPCPPPRPNGSRARAATVSWAGLLAQLNRFKQYPRTARQARIEGVVMLHFVMDAQGKVISYEIAKSSGRPILDAEALALIQRAQPLPAIAGGLPHPHPGRDCPDRVLTEPLSRSHSAARRLSRAGFPGFLARFARTEICASLPHALSPETLAGAPIFGEFFMEKKSRRGLLTNTAIAAAAATRWPPALAPRQKPSARQAGKALALSAARAFAKPVSRCSAAASLTATCCSSPASAITRKATIEVHTRGVLDEMSQEPEGCRLLAAEVPEGHASFLADLKDYDRHERGL